MRKALAWLLLFAPVAALPCSIIEEPIPKAIEQQGTEAILTYKMQRRFDLADVVFTGTVVSVTEVSHWDWIYGDWTNNRADIQPGRVWKNDGGNLRAVWTGTDSCGAHLHVRSQYVFFAGRHKSFWSFFPWVNETLGVGVSDVIWIGPLNAIAQEELQFHRHVSLVPLAKVLNAPELLNTPSN